MRKHRLRPPFPAGTREGRWAEPAGSTAERPGRAGAWTSQACSSCVSLKRHHPPRRGSACGQRPVVEGHSGHIPRPSSGFRTGEGPPPCRLPAAASNLLRAPLPPRALSLKASSARSPSSQTRSSLVQAGFCPGSLLRAFAGFLGSFSQVLWVASPCLHQGGFSKGPSQSAWGAES